MVRGIIHAIFKACHTFNINSIIIIYIIIIIQFGTTLWYNSKYWSYAYAFNWSISIQLDQMIVQYIIDYIVQTGVLSIVPIGRMA